VPARTLGHITAKTPQPGVSKTSSHERTQSRTSLAIGPDGTRPLSQQDLTPVYVLLISTPFERSITPKMVTGPASFVELT
jgi:hypothetical protein